MRIVRINRAGKTGKYFLLIPLVLSSCIFIPDSLIRTVYWTSQIRSNDLVSVSAEGFKAEENTVSVIEKSEFLLTAAENQAELNVLPFVEAFESSHEGNINAIDVRNSDIITGAQDGKVILHQRLESGGYLNSTLALGKKPIIALSVSPDGRYVAIAQFSVVSIIDLKKFELVAQMTQVKGRILSLAWHPDQESILFGRVDGNAFLWKLADEIEYSYNSSSVLEVYETESAPVTKLIFHPSNRAFFATTQTGGVFVVRLRKTEKELGIDNVGRQTRDIDEGKYVLRFAKVPGQINDSGLSANEEHLYVLSSEGIIYSWTIRGLVSAPTIKLPKDSAATLSRVKVDLEGKAPPYLYLTTGRSLRLRLWCAGSGYYEAAEPTTDVIKEEGRDGAGKSGDLSEDELISLLLSKTPTKASDLLSPAFSEASPEAKGLIFQTPSLRNSASVVKFDAENGILWLGDKTGKIVRFDAVSFLKSDYMASLIRERCLKT